MTNISNHAIIRVSKGKKETIMKTLKEFKSAIKVGTKLKVTTYWFGKPETAIRTVVKAQTNNFATSFTRENGEFIDGSWMDYPKAKDCKIHDNVMEVLTTKSVFDYGDEIVTTIHPRCGLGEGETWIKFELI